MTYVSEQTSAELRDHMKRLKRMDGWGDPLADRLWQEIQDQDEEITRLKREYAELESEAQRDYQVLEAQLGKADALLRAEVRHDLPFHAETMDGLNSLTIRK